MNSRVQQIKDRFETAASAQDDAATTRKLVFPAPGSADTTALGLVVSGGAGKEPLLVSLRVRPLDGRKQSVVEELEDGKSVKIVAPKSSAAYKCGEREEQFRFHRVFGPETTQEAIFDEVARPITAALVGQESNGLIFTFGVTNSGKTYTVHGTNEQPGLLPRALRVLFNSLEETGPAAERVPVNKTDFKYAVQVSYLEIYNELIYDLLADPATLGEDVKKTGLSLKIDPKGRIGVRDLREITVKSYDEAMRVLEQGKQARQVSETQLNVDSSRSHSVFTIKLCSIPKEHLVPEEVLKEKPLDHVRYHKLSIIDLAGSERAKRTNNSGARLAEASNINQSLMTFKRCIDALRHNQMNPQRPSLNVPYRDSKMTRLFQDFFSGHGGRAAMIVNVNPQFGDYDETSRVLKFSATAQDVRVPVSRIDTGRAVKVASRLNGEVFDGNLEAIGIAKPSEPKTAAAAASQVPPSSVSRPRKAGPTAAAAAAAPPASANAARAAATVGVSAADSMAKQASVELERLKAELEAMRAETAELRADNVRLEAAIREEVASEFAQEIFRNQLQCEERVMEIREALEDKYERKIEILDELNRSNMQRHAGKYQELVDEYNALADEKEALERRLQTVLAAQGSGSGQQYHQIIKDLEDTKRAQQGELKTLQQRIAELEAGKQEWKAKVGHIAEGRIAQLEQECAELREENRTLKGVEAKRTGRKWGLKKRAAGDDEEDLGAAAAAVDEDWANVSLEAAAAAAAAVGGVGDERKREKKKFGVGGSWRKRKAQQTSPATQAAGSNGGNSGAVGEADVLEILKGRGGGGGANAGATPKKHKKQPSRTVAPTDDAPLQFGEFASSSAARNVSDSMRLTDLLHKDDENAAPLRAQSPPVHKSSTSSRSPGKLSGGALSAELNVPVLRPVGRQPSTRSRAPSKFAF